VCAPGLPTNLPLPAVIGDGKDDDVASVDGEEGAGQATGDVAGTDVAEDDVTIRKRKGKEVLSHCMMQREQRKRMTDRSWRSFV
jgi:hypothetical protein